MTDYYQGLNVRVRYLHSDIETIERVEIIRDLRKGAFDVLVGINLLREGLDLPEVSLVAILDADKEGFLRSARSLIQTMGRASRNVNGTVILYADSTTQSMKQAMDETNRRRRLQAAFNKKHRITPRTIIKSLGTPLVQVYDATRETSGGINLLREGLDLPEVSLVAILDADKEGFLRSARSLIQTMGRASRNVNGTVILYADSTTQSMRQAIDETKVSYH